MHLSEPVFAVKLAQTNEELEAAQRLRYRVFVQELGSDGPMLEQEKQLERDRFDPFCDHLILTVNTRPGEVVGVYRLLTDARAARAGQFYSETEYDLTPLKESGRRLLELGRSCVDAEFRGGSAMYHLWQGLARYALEKDIEILFGVASFAGTDAQMHAAPLSLLHHNHLAPEALRVMARASARQSMDLVRADELDRRAAMVQMPALIKAYLRLGGCVGDGAYIDHAFNTTDVCLLLDTKQMNEKRKAIYEKGLTP